MILSRFVHGSCVASARGNSVISEARDWVEMMTIPRGSLCMFRNLDAWVVRSEVFPRMDSADLYAVIDGVVSSLTEGRWGPPVEAQFYKRRGRYALLFTWKSPAAELDKSTCCAWMIEALTIAERLQALIKPKNESIQR